MLSTHTFRVLHDLDLDRWAAIVKLIVTMVSKENLYRIIQHFKCFFFTFFRFFLFIFKKNKKLLLYFFFFSKTHTHNFILI